MLVPPPCCWLGPDMVACALHSHFHVRQGWGDSVNALTSSFRFALGTGRLFFLVWAARNDRAMWRIALEQPDFQWDWEEALANAHEACNLHATDVQSIRAFKRDDQPPPRVLVIRGTIVADHPLADSLQHFYRQRPSPTIALVRDHHLQDFLLRPNSELQSWIDRTRVALESDRSWRFGGVVGIQVRTGYADAAEVAQRPSNANFLADGDEQLFLDRFLNIYETRFGSDPTRTRVFLMTDSPLVRDFFFDQLQTRRGITVVTVSDGEVAHCGPTRTVSSSGVLRMLSEWFVFRRHTDLHLLTAWSLFGSSAVEGKRHDATQRIDASNCGQEGAKPCQMRRE